MKIQSTTLLIALFATVAGGCEYVDDGLEEGDVGTDDQASTVGFSRVTTNGLTMNGLTMNGLTMNGATADFLTSYPLSVLKYSFRTTLTSSRTRTFLKYMVECALPPGQSVQFQRKVYTSKTSYYYRTDTYYGQLGFAPEWLNDDCGTTCKEKVTGCLLARTNYQGQQVSISVRTWNDSVSSWEKDTYYLMEGAFYGDLFNGTTNNLYFCSSGPGQSNLRICDSVFDPDCPIRYTGPCDDPNPYVDRRACGFEQGQVWGGSPENFAVCADGDYIGNDPPLLENHWSTYTVTSHRSSLDW